MNRHHGEEVKAIVDIALAVWVLLLIVTAPWWAAKVRAWADRRRARNAASMAKLVAEELQRQRMPTT